MAHQYRYTPPTAPAGTPQPTASTSASYPYGAYYHPAGYTYATPYQAFAWPPQPYYYAPQQQQQQQPTQQQQAQQQQQPAQTPRPTVPAPVSGQPATSAATTPATTYQAQAYQTQTQAYQTPTTYQTPATYQLPAATTYTPQTTTYTPQYAAQPQTVPRSTTFTNYTPSYVRESGGTIGRGGRNKSNLRGLFTKELRNLMYGFGDDRNPSNDTVNVLEEILIEYITDVCQTAASSSKKSRLSLDDLRKALSRPADAKKLARMEELLFMQEEIKRARAQFESADMEKPPGF